MCCGERLSKSMAMATSRSVPQKSKAFSDITHKIACKNNRCSSLSSTVESDTKVALRRENSRFAKDSRVTETYFRDNIAVESQRMARLAEGAPRALSASLAGANPGFRRND